MAKKIVEQGIEAIGEVVKEEAVKEEAVKEEAVKEEAVKEETEIDNFSEQFKEFTGYEITHKLFGGYWEQATKALEAGDKNQAAHWLEGGLKIARMYIHQINNLNAMIEELKTIYQQNKQTYIDVIAELQSIASKPADTTYINAYARIATLEAQLEQIKNEVK